MDSGRVGQRDHLADRAGSAPGGCHENSNPNPRLRRSLIVAVMIGGILLAALMLPTGFFAVYPGPVFSLREMLQVEGYEPPPTSFYMVSVLAKDARAYSLILAMLSPSADIWAKSQVYQGRTPDEFIEDGKREMEASQKVAVDLAWEESGLRTGSAGGDQAPVRYSVKDQRVMGPSAGLPFALEVASRLKGEDLAGGRKIAATGALRSDGTVLPVGGVVQKTLACRDAGIEVFILPADEIAEARKYAGNMELVGVRSFREALGYLNRMDRGPR